MDFDDTPHEAAFRNEARAWLAANARSKDTGGAFESGLSEAEALAAARRWQATKARAGYAAITWPREFGGRGGTPIENVIFRQEERAFAVPFGYFEISLGMCIPTLMTFATDADKSRFVRPALFGEEIWCQLFSEPAAGSDLAGIRTRAKHDGGDWLINGQKVWTTGAQWSDWGLLLARTDPEKRKHEGLSMFYVDMRAPGVEVRPIRQMTGDSEFNEVFFTGVRIPDAQRLGDVGHGWRVALTTLMFERLSVGIDIGVISLRAFVDLVRGFQLNGRPALADQRTRERIADWYVESAGLRLFNYRALTALSRGQVPGPEQSIVKLVSARQGQAMANFAIDLAGDQGVVGAGQGSQWDAVERSWMWGAAMRIAGGTDEILRNVIAERVLGLPAEPRIDKGIPFARAD